jgi:hypothetical protein
VVTTSSETEGNNPKNIRSEASKHFRNKKREYLKEKINELASNSKNKNTGDLKRGIDKFKRAYQPRTNMVMDEMVICLQIPTTFFIGGKTTFFSY